MTRVPIVCIAHGVPDCPRCMPTNERERVLLARERNGDPFSGSWRIVPNGVMPVGGRDANYEYAFFERVS